MGLAGKIALCDPEDIAAGADLRRIKETGEILDRTDGPVSVRLCTVMHGNDDPGIQLLRHVSGGPGVDGIKTSNGKQEDIRLSQGFQLIRVQQAAQIAQMNNPKALRFQQEEEGFSTLGAAGVIMVGENAGDLYVRREGMETGVIDDLGMACNVFHGIVVMMVVGDEDAVRFERGDGVADRGVKGVRDNAETAFQGDEELGMANVLQ